MSTSPASSGRRVPGTVWLLAATVVAGVAGYAMQLAASAWLSDPALYIAFGTFWSAMYVMVALIGGVQNEVTRAVRPVREGETAQGGRDLLLVGLVGIAILVAVAVVAAMVRPDAGVAVAWMLVGGIGYLAITLLSGVMQGLAHWHFAAALTAADAALRAVLVLGAIGVASTATWIFGAIAAPFGFAVLAVGLFVWPRVQNHYVVDVSGPALLRQVAGVVVASASLGVLVSGLPMAMTAWAGKTSEHDLAEMIMVVGLSRAPLIVPLLAVQGIVIVRLRDAGHSVRSELVRLSVSLLSVTAVVAVLAAVIGPRALSLLTSDRYSSDATFIGITVASAGLLGVAVLLGAALLARSRHAAYVGLWVAAALTTLAILIGPGTLEARALVAMVAGPILGMAAAAATYRIRYAAGTTANR